MHRVDSLTRSALESGSLRAVLVNSARISKPHDDHFDVLPVSPPRASLRMNTPFGTDGQVIYKQTEDAHSDYQMRR